VIAEHVSEPVTPQSLAELADSVRVHAGDLLRAELELAKRELGAELGQAKTGLYLFALGAILINNAILLLCAAFVLAWGSSALVSMFVGLVVALVAGGALALAQHRLRLPQLLRTRARLAVDARNLLETHDG
jgi:Putative Actinobacterial Holin-X, holin superfamily III